MTTQRVMQGLENLEGREFNGLQIVRMVSRRPVTWEVQCTRCGSHWVEDHTRVRYIACRNTSCGRAPLEPRATLAQTGYAVTAVRSRDSGSAREYERQQKEPVIHINWTEEPTVEGTLAADPSSVRAYLDYLEKKSNVRT